ncbi:MAG: GNAT family N-acetyltransferase [Rhizomicrobium sp.]
MTRALLALQAATLFKLSAGRRMEYANDPERSPPPRLYMAGCEEGWVGYLRDDVDAAAARAVEDLIAQEPPLAAPGATPRFAERYREIVGSDAPLTTHNYGPIHRLRRGVQAPSTVKVVCQGTAEGDALWTRLERDGLAPDWIAAGFTDLSHFWEPWCVAMAGDEIAAIAFAARTGLLAAEVGVYTLKAHRGRGYAAAVTAAWSTLLPRHPVLFYATHRDNLSSQRVIARLGLPFLGESMWI